MAAQYQQQRTYNNAAPPPYPTSTSSSSSYPPVDSIPAQPAPVYATHMEYPTTNITRAPGHLQAHPQNQLKSMHLVEQYRAPSPYDDHRRSRSEEHLVAGDYIESQPRELDVVDKRLKRHIRILRLVSRILAFIVSVLVFVPITMTLIKFLTTRTISRTVPLAANPEQREQRTAWAKNTTTWPTYMYFGTASVSLLLNVFIMGSYLRKNVTTGNLKMANTGAYIATTFSWVVMVGNAVVWGVAASLYRTEKKTNDLWGWTCSDTAQSIQRVFEKEVNFGQYCNVQSFSWYAGVVQALLAILTVVVFVLILKRRKTQKRLLEKKGDEVVLLAKH